MTGKRDRLAKAAGKRRTAGEKRRGVRRLNHLLVQLIASAAIFLLVFVGGGLIPDQVFDVFGAVRQVVSGDESLLQSVEALGQAISQGEGWPGAVREWCIDTFLPAAAEADRAQEESARLEEAGLYHRYLYPDLPEHAGGALPAASTDKQ